MHEQSTMSKIALKTLDGKSMVYLYLGCKQKSLIKGKVKKLSKVYFSHS